jgi:dipeptidyl aminopeptidase/acylaminoacyl peptidase
MDLETQSLTQLTNEAYNEHAIYSPDGEKIVWMSDKDNRNKGTDYWLMNPDGSEKNRLTYFNQRGHPHYMGKKITVADSSWSPDGKRIVAYYHDMKNVLQALFFPNRIDETIIMFDLTENDSVHDNGMYNV